MIEEEVGHRKRGGKKKTAVTVSQWWARVNRELLGRTERGKVAPSRLIARMCSASENSRRKYFSTVRLW